MADEKRKIKEYFDGVQPSEDFTRRLLELGFRLYATEGTAAEISRLGTEVEVVGKLGRDDRVMKLLSASLEGLEEWNIPDSILALLEKDEQQVDDDTESLRQKHIDRLKEHKCTPKSGVIYLETLNNLERVADHAMNIVSCARDESIHARA